AVRWVVHTRHDLARANTIGIDWVVILFAVGLTLLSGFLAGGIAAISGTDDKALDTLRESSRTHTSGPQRARLRRGLLSIEMGLTVVLLIGAGLLLKGYEGLRNRNLGSGIDGELTMHFALPETKYGSTAQRALFFERLLEQVRQVPGVERAGLVTR